MDADIRAVVEGLGEALSGSGLTQAEFAAALGTSASRFSAYRAGKTVPSAAFYLRALRLAASLKAARERGWMTPQSAAREIHRALRQGDIAGAGLDVFEGEPKIHAGYLGLPNAVLTPHIGSATRATRLRMCETAVANLTAVLEGRPPPNLVNKELA